MRDNVLTHVLPQGYYLACMTAILKQMDDMHYAHHISTFKTRQDIIVSVPGSSAVSQFSDWSSYFRLTRLIASVAASASIRAR